MQVALSLACSQKHGALPRPPPLTCDPDEAVPAQDQVDAPGQRDVVLVESLDERRWHHHQLPVLEL